MNVLFLSNLFPDADHPMFGIHNAVLVRNLANACNIAVISPRPAIGSFLARRGTPGASPCPPDAGLAVEFPRVPYVPKLGSAVNHRLFAHWLQPCFRAACHTFSPDVVLAAWTYPDGCAAVRLCSPLGLACVVVAQGTDVHDYLHRRVRRGIILSHLRRADAVVTRSESLRQHLLGAGLGEDHVHTIYNGVDADTFRPLTGSSREALRQSLGLPPDAKIILFVGNLVPVKNPMLAFEAFQRLRSSWSCGPLHMVMLGDGPLRAKLESAVRRAGAPTWISLPGRCPQHTVARYMQAADALCVSSRNEGAPNVVREAAACGLPTAATAVGGIPELITDPSVGELAESETGVDLASALSRVLTRHSRQPPARTAPVGASWANTVRRYLDLFRHVCSQRPVVPTQHGTGTGARPSP